MMDARGFATGVVAGVVVLLAGAAGAYAAARPRLREWTRKAVREGLIAYGARAQREERNATTRTLASVIGSETGSALVAGVVAEVIDREAP